MESVDVVKRRGVVGLGGQLYSCCGWFVVLALLFSCVGFVPADCLQPTSNERSSVGSIVDSRVSSDEGSSLIDIATDSLNPNDEAGTAAWELPIVTGRTCDLASRECGGGSIVTDEAIADAKAGDVVRKEPEGKMEEGVKQAVVLCNVKCFRADPVCGEDAITYWCGAAEAKCAGVEVAYKGYCDSRSGGAGKDGTRAAQSLFLVHLIWLVLAGFLVVADLL